MEELENSKTVQQYNEMWRVSYNDRMEKKLKDLKDTDKVTLSLDLLTPLFMDQGSYTVQIYSCRRTRVEAAQMECDFKVTNNCK